MHAHQIVPPISSTKKKKPVTVDFYQTIEESLRLMGAHGVHHLVVLQGDKVYGVVSDRDIYQTWTRFGIEKASLMSVGHSCTPSPCLTPRSSLKEAVDLMVELQCSGICIADDEKPIGIMTTTDMVRILYRTLDDNYKTEPDVIRRGQVALSHPLMVNLMQIVSEAGI